MADYTELKRLAEAANAVTGDVSVDITISSEAGPNQAEIDAVTAFIGAATPAAVLSLIAENERLSESDQEATELCDTLSVLLGEIAVAVRGPEEPKSRHGFHDLPSRVKTVVAERDQLKAENFQLDAQVDTLTEWYLNALKDAAAIGKDCDQVKAENEALRDDIEQSQYDANAWRNGEESVWIEVFNSEGDDPFISAISGQITVEQLALIQEEILEYREDYFEKGSGLYVFRCGHCQAHYDNVGMTEPAHWETDFESYSPFPWEEEAAAMANGEQS